MSGPLVRIGPNELLCTDPDVLRHMSTVRSTYTKGAFYSSGRIVPGVDNVVSMRDEVRYKAMRAKMAPGVGSLWFRWRRHFTPLVFRQGERGLRLRDGHGLSAAQLHCFARPQVHLHRHRDAPGRLGREDLVLGPRCHWRCFPWGALWLSGARRGPL